MEIPSEMNTVDNLTQHPLFGHAFFKLVTKKPGFYD